jgi:hypothetical protein
MPRTRDANYAIKGGTPARLGYYDNYLVDNRSCVIVGIQGTAARMSQETVHLTALLASPPGILSPATIPCPNPEPYLARTQVISADSLRHSGLFPSSSHPDGFWIPTWIPFTILS